MPEEKREIPVTQTGCRNRQVGMALQSLSGYMILRINIYCQPVEQESCSNYLGCEGSICYNERQHICGTVQCARKKKNRKNPTEVL